MKPDTPDADHLDQFDSVFAELVADGRLVPSKFGPDPEAFTCPDPGPLPEIQHIDVLLAVVEFEAFWHGARGPEARDLAERAGVVKSALRHRVDSLEAQRLVYVDEADGRWSQFRSTGLGKMVAWEHPKWGDWLAGLTRDNAAKVLDVMDTALRDCRHALLTGDVETARKVAGECRVQVSHLPLRDVTTTLLSALLEALFELLDHERVSPSLVLVSAMQVAVDRAGGGS